MAEQFRAISNSVNAARSTSNSTELLHLIHEAAATGRTSVEFDKGTYDTTSLKGFKIGQDSRTVGSCQWDLTTIPTVIVSWDVTISSTCPQSITCGDDAAALTGWYWYTTFYQQFEKDAKVAAERGDRSIERKCPNNSTVRLALEGWFKQKEFAITKNQKNVSSCQWQPEWEDYWVISW